tara:strand:- start:378 stop:1514 length:1137 start_codon:yes stop_codon:yes gene_type:complete
MKIYYWSPFTSNVATIKAVINSAYGLKKFFRFDTYIINSFGEWNSYKREIKLKKIKLIDNSKKSKILFTQGYFFSRIAFIRIFFHSFFFLKNILVKKKPEYLIVHLITSLPLILFLLFKFNTKLVLRISGQPKLNFFRKFIWKMSRQNIHFVTVPTKETLKNLKKMNIFDPSKIYYLPDPVFINQKINKVLKKKIKNNYQYIINVGRLTEQKNQKILIQSFKEISKNYKNLKLLILGKGEKYLELLNLTKKLNLEHKVNFLGHVSYPYEYIKGSLCVIVTSLWEDPGFVMIESSALKKIVINSDCPSGPKEFFNKGKTGFLFKNNSMQSLINTFDRFMNSNNSKLKLYIRKNYLKSLEYSEINHSKIFKKIFKIYEKK